MKKLNIITYDLPDFLSVHRVYEGDSFGNNRPYEIYAVEGFELYSTDGMCAALGPLKTSFYWLDFNLTGSVNVELDLVSYTHTANSIHFKPPEKIYARNNPSLGQHGYYLFFTKAFIEKVMPMFGQMKQQFPFLGNGVPIFELNTDEASEVKDLLLKMERELRHNIPNREWMLGTYLFQLFITAHRSYTRQHLQQTNQPRQEGVMLERFNHLVKQNFRNIRSVNWYAEKLSITPNHLNRLIKQQSGKTASSIIQETLLIEAKSLIKYSDKSISEIVWELGFTDSAHFTHFFKQATGQTPTAFKNNNA